MPALINELISKVDNVEIVRDQIGAILKLELANQAILSGNPQPRVFVERTNPWGMFIDAEPTALPILNVWFETESFDGKASNIVERQAAEATFNIDAYGYGVSIDDGAIGSTEGGHTPGDQAAVFDCQRTLRLARNILMSAHYTYLGLRGLVWKRWPTSITMLQSASDERAAQHISGGRLALQVTFSEFSPQVTGDVLETLSIEVLRANTAELYLRADYPKE
jgi:hypothetical protein